MMCINIDMRFVVIVSILFILLTSHVIFAQEVVDSQGDGIKDKNTALIEEGEVDEKEASDYSYEQYKHRLELRGMRAGVHDSDTSSYTFKVQGYGLINNREERKKPLVERESVLIEIGSFADVALKPLTSWVQEEDSEGHRLEIDGEMIRELVVNTMRKLKQEERKVSVLVEVGLYLKQTKYMVWSDEVEIAKMGYFVIPYTQEALDKKENMMISFEEKGVEATLELLWASDPKTPQLEKL
ncbi:MAG: hypothetical protein AB8C84_06390 [Oligoflexales bacterium]